jgi:hypothetical protein
MAFKIIKTGLNRLAVDAFIEACAIFEFLLFCNHTDYTICTHDSSLSDDTTRAKEVLLWLAVAENLPTFEGSKMLRIASRT